MNVSDAVMSTIETALRKGHRLRGFMSGGGLRVFRIEDAARELVGYGEHPHAEEAFRILADDLTTGGRDYSAVYGKTETHYLTGASTPNEGLDAWLRAGNKVEAHAEQGGFVVVLRGYQHHETPKDIAHRAMGGETVQWTDGRGYAFESTPCRFPNGDPGMSTRCLSEAKNGADPWIWQSSQRGEGASLREAITRALTATPTEDK